MSKFDLFPDVKLAQTCEAGCVQAEVFAIVVEEVVVEVAVAAVEVEVGPGLQLVKPPSSSLAASHRLRRPTSPQTHSHSLGENLTLVVRTKMKWELA